MSGTEWSGLTLALGDEALDRVADRIAERLVARMGQISDPGEWMTTADAAQYLHRPISAIRKLTASRQIPFHQSSPGARCYFKRSELDRWMAS